MIGTFKELVAELNHSLVMSKISVFEDKYDYIWRIRVSDSFDSFFVTCEPECTKTLEDSAAIACHKLLDAASEARVVVSGHDTNTIIDFFKEKVDRSYKTNTCKCCGQTIH